MTEDTSPENLRKFLESDDPAMVLMGLSMAKGTGVSDDLLALICGLYMWHDDTKVRATAKSTFMKLAPDDVKAIIKEKWRSNYRTRRYPVSDFCPECGQPRTSRHKSCCVRFVSVNVLEDLFAGLKNTSLNNIFLWIPAKASLMWEGNIREMISLHYPSESLNLFLDMLKHDESYVRFGAVEAIDVMPGKKSLTEIQTEEVIDALIQTLEDDNEDLRGRAGGMNLRNKAAAVLSTFEKKRIIEPLITALANDTERPNPAVATALGSIGDERGFEPLVKALSAASEVTMWRAAEALLHFEATRVVEPFIKALENEGRVSTFVTEELGKIGDTRAVEPLIKAFEEGRVGAAKALGAIGDKRAVEPLIEMLERDDKGNARRSAAYALGEIGDVRAVQPLIKALGDDDVDIRYSAAGALGEIGDARAIKPLIKSLEDENYNPSTANWDTVRVRGAVAHALGKIGDKQAVEPLIKASGDKDYNVRQHATKALKKLGHEVE